MSTLISFLANHRFLFEFRLCASSQQSTHIDLDVIIYILHVLYIYEQRKRKERIARSTRYLQACFCFRADRGHYRFDKPSFRKHVRCLDVFGTVRSARGYVEDERKRRRETEKEKRQPGVCTRIYLYTTLIQSQADEDTLYRGPWLCLSSSRSVSASSFVFSPK